MDCSRIRQIILEDPDIDMPEEIRQSVEAHVDACQPCAMRLAILREQLEALRTLPEVKPPDDFLDRLRRRMEEPSISKKNEGKVAAFWEGWRFFHWAGVAAALLLVIVTYQTVQKGALEEREHVSPAPIIGMDRLQPAAPERMSPQDAGQEEPVLSAVPRSAAPSPESRQERVLITLALPRASLGGKASAPSKPVESESDMQLRERAALVEEGKERAKGSARRGEGKIEKFSLDAYTPARDRILDEIRQIILLIDGKVLQPQPGSGAGTALALDAEAPASAYGALLKELGRFGKIETTQSEPPADDGIIRLRIELLPPE